MMEQILTNIADIAPVIGVLVVGIFYFFKKEKEYKQEISDLQAELRNCEKENLTVLMKVLAFFEKIEDKINK